LNISSCLQFTVQIAARTFIVALVSCEIAWIQQTVTSSLCLR